MLISIACGGGGGSSSNTEINDVFTNYNGKTEPAEINSETIEKVTEELSDLNASSYSNTYFKPSLEKNTNTILSIFRDEKNRLLNLSNSKSKISVSGHHKTYSFDNGEKYLLPKYSGNGSTTSFYNDPESEYSFIEETQFENMFLVDYEVYVTGVLKTNKDFSSNTDVLYDSIEFQSFRTTSDDGSYNEINGTVLFDDFQNGDLKSVVNFSLSSDNVDQSIVLKNLVIEQEYHDGRDRQLLKSEKINGVIYMHEYGYVNIIMEEPNYYESGEVEPYSEATIIIEGKDNLTAEISLKPLELSTGVEISSDSIDETLTLDYTITDGANIIPSNEILDQDIITFIQGANVTDYGYTQIYNDTDNSRTSRVVYQFQRSGQPISIWLEMDDFPGTPNRSKNKILLEKE